MPQDAFTILHTAKELDSLLKDARVDRINQPDKDSVIFYLRKDRFDYYLTACAKADFSRLSIGAKPTFVAVDAPSFCMLLRKHLSRSVIEQIRAIKDERIIAIDFLCRDELGETSEKTLYCEIMGKYSNVILVQSGTILGAMKTTSFDSDYPRRIFSGVPYILPEKQEKTSLFDEEAAKNLLANFNGHDLTEFVFNNFLGLSRATAQDIETKYFQNVKVFKIDEFYKYFKDYYESPFIKPNVVFGGKESDFYIGDYTLVQGNKTYYKTIAEAIDAYYKFKTESKAFGIRKQKLKDIVNAYLKKQQKKLQIVNEKLLSCDDADKNTLYGQLIISNLYRIKSGMKEVELEDFTKEDYPKITVKLDDKLSPKENAERYFKRYDKQKKTLAAVSNQKDELNELIAYLEQILKEIDSIEQIEDFVDIDEELKLLGLIKVEAKKKEKVKTTKYRVYSYGGFEIFVGKNNVQNEKLTFSAERSDIWLHAKDFHSSHVIIKTHGETVPDNVLLFAAEVCAYYSDAREADKVPIDYTLKKHVKKSNGKAIGLVYYTDQKTLFVKPDSHL